MNAGNLIPNSQRTRQELREMGRKGGIASGKARRKKKELKKIAKWILSDTAKELSEYWKFQTGGNHHDK